LVYYWDTTTISSNNCSSVFLTSKKAAEEHLLQKGGLWVCLGTAITTAIILISSYFNKNTSGCYDVEAEFLISIAGNIFSISLYGRHEWKEIASEIIHFVMILTFIFRWVLLRFVFYSLCQRPILVKTYCTQKNYKQSYEKGHLRLL